jgi:hypothetical protein
MPDCGSSLTEPARPLDEGHSLTAKHLQAEPSVGTGL